LLAASSNAPVLPGGPLRDDVLETLCALLIQLNSEFTIFVPTIEKIMAHHRISHDKYAQLVSRLLRQQSLSSVEFNHQISFEDITSTRTEETSATSPANTDVAVKKLHVNQANLKKAWEAAQRSTKDDWLEWMRRFSVELLKESPSPALRSCSALAQKYHVLARELFNAAFVSCWTELYDQYQDDLVRSLEAAFKSSHIPPEILQTLLNLAEFMEHDDKALPIDIRTLGGLAEKCHAYAKALHYKELEFHTQPSATIEALISINNQLQQPEAAVGILEYAQQHHAIELKESWYEKLQRWEDALEAYERRQLEDPASIPVTLGRMRCLRALGEWDRLSQLSADLWTRTEDQNIKREVAPLAAAASWRLGQWNEMEHYVKSMNDEEAEGNFFRAIVGVRRREFDKARASIDKARHLLDGELQVHFLILLCLLFLLIFTFFFLLFYFLTFYLLLFFFF
jgi:FKBP12-rapamycin complex-associated protein